MIFGIGNLWIYWNMVSHSIFTGMHLFVLLKKIMLVHSGDVRTYIVDELKHGAMLGPFQSKPIDLHVSPFMTREKPDSSVRRTIVNLSWPESYSGNAGVARDEYLGLKFLWHYPSVDDIVNKLNELGLGTFMFKVDISRAFCQLKVDPGDIDLLGLKQDAYFIDQLLPFGYRHGSILF